MVGKMKNKKIKILVLSAMLIVPTGWLMYSLNGGETKEVPVVSGGNIIIELSSTGELGYYSNTWIDFPREGNEDQELNVSLSDLLDIVEGAGYDPTDEANISLNERDLGYEWRIGWSEGESSYWFEVDGNDGEIVNVDLPANTTAVGYSEVEDVSEVALEEVNKIKGTDLPEELFTEEPDIKEEDPTFVEEGWRLEWKQEKEIDTDGLITSDEAIESAREKALSNEYLFSLDRSKYRSYLEESPVAPELIEAFEDEGYEVGEDAVLSEDDGDWWIIEDEKLVYRIEVEDEELNIYTNELFFRYQELIRSATRNETELVIEPPNLHFGEREFSEEMVEIDGREVYKEVRSGWMGEYTLLYRVNFIYEESTGKRIQIQVDAESGEYLGMRVPRSP